MEESTPYEIQLKNAQQQIEHLNQQLKAITDASSEPIAIIGMAMRFPGNVNSPEDFWNMLINGIDGICDIPALRWDKEKYYHPKPGTKGKMYTKQGGYLDGIDMFDQTFFDISPIELESTDPQQRLLLEVTHEAFENAGIDVQSLIGSNTAVFIGNDNVDYAAKHFRTRDYNLVNGYSYVGSSTTALAGRISYLMGLQGPCMMIDTACSSSFVVAHLASNALRNKECDIAVIGSAGLILEPEGNISFCQLSGLSPECRCKSFDNDANGYIRSEGVGIMILKRLSDAQKADDNILAIIKGSAVNQDGKSKRFTAPSTKAQTQVIAQALKNANINPEQIDFLETHGTGTKIGDPAEMRGILGVYQHAKTKQHPLLIGSCKSNIGHMECASGMASISKIILALKHNLIPKNIHFNVPNELIDWNNIPVKVVAENTPWNGTQRFAGTSGFGITGTNAHLIIGDAPENPFQLNKQKLRNNIYILPISAKSEQALLDLAKAYASFIQNTNYNVEDICAMASLRRAHYTIREVFIATSKEQLIENLQSFSTNNFEYNAVFKNPTECKTVFVFPGQGSQWIRMGKSLYENELVFRAALDECNQVFKKYVKYDLLEEINKPIDSSRLTEIDVVQPILIAMEIALANLWMSKGIIPDIVIGHSMGEIAAAYVAGNITLEDAAKIIATRSKLMKQLSGKGEMGATDLSVEEANKLLIGYEDKLSVAVINSRNSTVLSGDPAALNEIFAKLESQERFNKKVKVDVASHSPQMDVIKQDLLNALETIQPKNSSIHFYSTCLNKLVNGENLNAEYWTNNLRNPVQFGNAINAVLADNEVVFIEMSPHPILIHSINENTQILAANAVAIPSFQRDKNELSEFYKNIATLYNTGYSFDWKTIYPNIGEFVNLPYYAWQKERFWFNEKPTINNIAFALDTNLSNNISANLYEISWQEINFDNNIIPKKILIIKDNYGHYKNVEEILISKNCIVKSIDLDDRLDGVEADIVLHFRSFYKEAIFNLYLECGILSIQKLVNYFSEKNQYPKICCITNGAQIINNYDKNINLNASTIIGVLRTIENEHSEFNFLNIDISNEINSDEVNKVAYLIFADNKFKEIAVRNNQTYTNVLCKKTANNIQKTIKENNTYIVVGGTSGLGLETVKWLSKKGAKNIAVISRTGAKEDTLGVFSELHNTTITEYFADVANLEQVKIAFQQIEKELPIVAGIIFAAGILEDGAFDNLSKEQFQNVIQIKSNGAWNFHQITNSLALDFFVLYSSAAGVFGSPGQSNYAAANTMLDQLANYRKSIGKTAVSIDWGTIAEVGLSAREDVRGERLITQGVLPIYPHDLSDYFDNLILSENSQIIALQIDFEVWASYNTAIKQNNFYKNVVQQIDEKTVETETATTDFNNVDEEKLHIKKQIKQHISAVTKIAIHKIKEDDTFKSIGIDSLLALQIKNKIQEEFSMQLNISAIWSYPTVNKLTDFIANELRITEKYTTVNTDVVQQSSTNNNDIESSVKNLSLEELMKELSNKVD